MTTGRFVLGGLALLTLVVVAGLWLTRDPAFCDSTTLEVTAHSPRVGEPLGELDATRVELTYEVDDRFEGVFHRELRATWSPTTASDREYFAFTVFEETSGRVLLRANRRFSMLDGSAIWQPTPEDEIREVLVELIIARLPDDSSETVVVNILRVSVGADGQSRVVSCQEGG